MGISPSDAQKQPEIDLIPAMGLERSGGGDSQHSRNCLGLGMAGSSVNLVPIIRVPEVHTLSASCYDAFCNFVIRVPETLSAGHVMYGDTDLTGQQTDRSSLNRSPLIQSGARTRYAAHPVTSFGGIHKHCNIEFSA